jgi:hypothetical protein
MTNPSLMELYLLKPGVVVTICRDGDEVVLFVSSLYTLPGIIPGEYRGPTLEDAVAAAISVEEG